MLHCSEFMPLKATLPDYNC